MVYLEDIYYRLKVTLQPTLIHFISLYACFTECITANPILGYKFKIKFSLNLTQCYFFYLITDFLKCIVNWQSAV